jgi:hypothetical protein
MRSHNPAPEGTVWAIPVSLATTQGISLISFPPGTEMFQFPGCRLSRLFDSPGDARVLPGRVSPFGDPRIKAC